jgi:hypothetical protein
VGGTPAARPDPVALGQGREDRLVPAAADDLDLAAPDEPAEALDELRTFGGDPVEEGTGVVEGKLDAGVPFEGLEHRQVGLVEGLGNHPAEVAHGLVVVDRQCQRDATGHGGHSLAAGQRLEGFRFNRIDVATVTLVRCLNRFAKPVCRNVSRMIPAARPSSGPGVTSGSFRPEEAAWSIKSRDG